MTSLHLPIPPTLEAALGIPDTGILVTALFRGVGGSPRFSDGRVCGGCCPAAFEAFAGHPVIAPALVPFGFSHADRPSDHWILFGKVKRWSAAAPAGWAKAFVRSSYPPWEPFTVLEPVPAGDPVALAATTAWLNVILAWRF
jgi:hypothetical protein